MAVSQCNMVPVFYHGIVWRQSDSDTALGETEGEGPAVAHE